MMFIKYATVTNISPFKVRFDSDTEESKNTGYKHLDSYTPHVGDRVAFLGKLCLGKVV